MTSLAIIQHLNELQHIGAGDEQCRACLEMSMETMMVCRKCISATPEFNLVVRSVMESKKQPN